MRRALLTLILFSDSRKTRPEQHLLPLPLRRPARTAGRTSGQLNARQSSEGNIACAPILSWIAFEAQKVSKVGERVSHRSQMVCSCPSGSLRTLSGVSGMLMFLMNLLNVVLVMYVRLHHPCGVGREHHGAPCGLRGHRVLLHGGRAEEISEALAARNDSSIDRLINFSLVEAALKLPLRSFPDLVSHFKRVSNGQKINLFNVHAFHISYEATM